MQACTCMYCCHQPCTCTGGELGRHMTSQDVTAAIQPQAHSFTSWGHKGNGGGCVLRSRHQLRDAISWLRDTATALEHVLHLDKGLQKADQRLCRCNMHPCGCICRTGSWKAAAARPAFSLVQQRCSPARSSKAQRRCTLARAYGSPSIKVRPR
jgi:hypothetical protein